LSSLFDNIHWIASFASTKLASVRRQLSPSLSFRNLTKTTLAVSAESFHTFSATTILHNEVWFRVIVFMEGLSLVVIVVVSELFSESLGMI
jgi:hypothetical protein